MHRHFWGLFLFLHKICCTLFCRLLFVLIIALLRYNSHIIKFTHLKYNLMGFFLGIFRIACLHNQFQNICGACKRNPISQCPSPAPGTYFFLCRFAFLLRTFSINGIMWIFVPDFFHLVQFFSRFVHAVAYTSFLFYY